MKSQALFSLLILHFWASAQMVTEPGKIVTLSGDTLRGEISIRRSDQNPRFIEFSDGSSEKRYFPHQIRSFQLDANTSYAAIITQVDKSPSRIEDFNSEITIARGTVTDTVFLFLVASGSLSLYRLIDENNKTHYYLSKDDTFTELIRTVRPANVAGPLKLQTNDVYKRQLRNFITNCPRAEAIIDNTPYYRRDLSKLVMEYNSCHPSELDAKVQKEDKAQVRIVIHGGISIPKSAFKADTDYAPYTATYTSPSSFTGGAVVEIVARKRLAGLAVVNELVLNGFEFTADTPPADPYRLHFKYVRYNLGMRYYLTREKTVQPFVQAGVGIGFTYNRSYNLGPTTNNTNAEMVGNDEFGLHAATGVRFKRMCLQGRFDRASGPSQVVAFAARVNSWQVLLSVDLNKTRP